MWRKVLVKFCIVIVIINLIILNTSYAVDAKEQINFKNITIEDGLTQGSVETLFQDSKGYIWIGTNDGLNRYNGYKFKVYKTEEDKGNSLVNNYILDIKEDKPGNIWVGTVNGISKINSDGKSITNYLGDVDNGNLSNININNILITRDNKILVATADGLNIYDKESDNFKRICNGDELLSSYIEALAEDNEGNIWAGTDSGISKINLTSGEVEYFVNSEDSNSISDNEVFKLYYDPRGHMWVGTVNNGACKIDLKSNKVTRYYHELGNEKSLGGDFIKSFLRDSNGDMWIATENGLSKYNYKSNTFITYKNKIYDGNSLVDNNIYSLFQDKSGLIWIGTYSGISIFNPNSQIQHYKNDPFDEKTISDNMISALYEDKDGYIWIGSKNSGVDIINRDTDKIVNISTKSHKEYLPSDDIRDITGNEDDIFIATTKGLVIVNKKDNTYKVYDENNGLPSQNLRCVLYDELGFLWIGTVDGVVVLNLETDEITNITYIIEKYSITDKYISDIYKDNKGEYWIGTFVQGGLIRISPEEERVNTYRNIEEDSKSISNNSIRSITESEDGSIWIGTSFGLNRFDKSSGKFEVFTTSDGMANNTIYGVLIDNEGNPWCSTNIGISKVNIQNNTIINLDITDGLQSNEFNGNAYFKRKNGELLFGGINGLNIINPEKIKENEGENNLVFDEFKINGISVDNIDGNSLEYHDNNIYIEAFLPNYKNVNGIQYYYCLEGGSDEWIPMDGNSITLSNLSPGYYVFKIKARSNSGIISNEAQISFRIKPPFWAGRYAVIFYILAIVILILHNKNKVKKLDRLVDKRTKELSEEMDRNKELFNKVIKLEKSKNNYLINLSHELRTPLNVICSTEQLIRKLNKDSSGIEKDKLDKYMVIMNNNTNRLLKIINDLIDTSKIEHGSYRIDIKEINIVYVVEDAALSLREYIEGKGLELIIDPEMEEKIIEADPNEIERCIVNIVGNAYKFTSSGGYIKVSIKDLGDFVRIEILDNGIGIGEKYHELIFNRFNQIVDVNAEVKKGSGLGLTITKKIVDLHKGDIFVESEVGKGSKFIIILPVKQSKTKKIIEANG